MAVHRGPPPATVGFVSLGDLKEAKALYGKRRKSST